MKIDTVKKIIESTYEVENPFYINNSDDYEYNYKKIEFYNSGISRKENEIRCNKKTGELWIDTNIYTDDVLDEDWIENMWLPDKCEKEEFIRFYETVIKNLNKMIL